MGMPGIHHKARRTALAVTVAALSLTYAAAAARNISFRALSNEHFGEGTRRSSIDFNESIGEYLRDVDPELEASRGTPEPPSERRSAAARQWDHAVGEWHFAWSRFYRSLADHLGEPLPRTVTRYENHVVCMLPLERDDAAGCLLPSKIE